MSASNKKHIYKNKSNNQNKKYIKSTNIMVTIVKIQKGSRDRNKK